MRGQPTGERGGLEGDVDGTGNTGDNILVAPIWIDRADLHPER